MMSGEHTKPREVLSEDLVTIESLCAQIDDVGRKANALIDAISGQRNETRKRLVEANSMLRTLYQVIERRGASTNWEELEKRLYELLERQRVFINAFNGYNVSE